MCGIAGAINGSPRIIQSLLLAMEARGMDSVGVASITPKGAQIVKGVEPASQNVFTKEFVSLLNTAPHAVIIGHTRAASVGTVTPQNAHPFQFKKPTGGQIIGCHNGTLHSIKGMPWHEVDSQSLLHHIANVGHEKALNNIKGSYVLVWFDTMTGRLHLARGGNRPLHYAFSDKSFYYASTPEALRSVLVAAGHTSPEIFSLEDGKHISLNDEGEIMKHYTHPIPTSSFWNNLVNTWRMI